MSVVGAIITMLSFIIGMGLGFILAIQVFQIWYFFVTR